MHLHTIAILVFSLSIVGCGNSQPMPNYAETRLQVIAIETAFAKTMSDRDHDAFSTFIADDAVFFAGDDPLRGKEQVVSWWARYYPKTHHSRGSRRTSKFSNQVHLPTVQDRFAIPTVQ
jgi:hypothetical protein